MIKLMNDVFDICNGRFIAAGINERNWGMKHAKLMKFLKILDITEDFYKKEVADMKIKNKKKKKTKRNKKVAAQAKDSDCPYDEQLAQHYAATYDDDSGELRYDEAADPLKETRTKATQMFMATTTLRSWRVTVLSTISLTEKMLNAGYLTVLTGKLNQDPIEVTKIKPIVCLTFLTIFFFLALLRNSTQHRRQAYCPFVAPYLSHLVALHSNQAGSEARQYGLWRRTKNSSRLSKMFS